MQLVRLIKQIVRRKSARPPHGSRESPPYPTRSCAPSPSSPLRPQSAASCRSTAASCISSLKCRLRVVVRHRKEIQPLLRRRRPADAMADKAHSLPRLALAHAIRAARYASAVALVPSGLRIQHLVLLRIELPRKMNLHRVLALRIPAPHSCTQSRCATSQAQSAPASTARSRPPAEIVNAATPLTPIPLRIPHPRRQLHSLLKSRRDQFHIHPLNASRNLNANNLVFPGSSPSQCPHAAAISAPVATVPCVRLRKARHRDIATT